MEHLIIDVLGLLIALASFLLAIFREHKKTKGLVIIKSLCGQV